MTFGRGIMKKVTNGNIGRGGGVGLKFGIFAMTSFLNGPNTKWQSQYYISKVFCHKFVSILGRL